MSYVKQQMKDSKRKKPKQFKKFDKKIYIIMHYRSCPTLFKVTETPSLFKMGHDS